MLVMTEQHLGFNEEFYFDIINRDKTETLRYKPRHRLPEVGDTVFAVISHDDGPFAKLKITDVYTMTVREVIEADFDNHQNYDSLEHFRERMSEYYDASEFDYETELYMIEFDVVEVLD